MLLDKAIVRLALPVFLGHLLAFLLGVADTLFISFLDRGSTVFISGIGLTMPLNLLALAVATGLMAGAASMTARALGAGDKSTLVGAGRGALLLGLGGAVLFGAACYLGGSRLIGLFSGPSVDGATKAAALQYLHTVTPSYALLVAELSLLGLLLGLGKTKVYGTAMALATLINLVLDPLFIFTFHLSVGGAGLATTVSSCFATLYVVAELSKASSTFAIPGTRAPSASDAELGELVSEREPSANATVGAVGGVASGMKEIVRVGLPQTLSLLVVSLSFVFLNRVMADFGPVRLNAWIIVGRVEECVLMIGYAVGNAALILAGQYWGGGARSTLRALPLRALRTSLVLCVVVLVPYILAAPLIFRSFSGNVEVVDACARQVRAISWSTTGVVLSLIAVSGLQGMGKARSPLLLIVLRLGLFLVVPLFILHRLGILTFPLFLVLFASANALGGLISHAVFVRGARSLPRDGRSGVSS